MYTSPAMVSFFGCQELLQPALPAKPVHLAEGRMGLVAIEKIDRLEDDHFGTVL
jgi:hypothetical protein